MLGCVTASLLAQVPALFLQSPIVPIWFATSGAVGAAGAGGFTLPVTIPVSAVFVGLPFVSQAFLLDPAVPGGVAVTRAVETWIG